MSLTDLKVNAKKHNATVNDWFTACLVKAIKDYYENHSEDNALLLDNSSEYTGGKLPQS